MEITHHSDSDANREQASEMTMAALLKKSPSRFDLSGVGSQPGPPRRFQIQGSFSSSDDSTPELEDDDRADSLSSFDEEDHQYEPSTEELWNSFWGNGKLQERGWVGEDGPRCTVRDEDTAPAFLAGSRYRPTSSRRHWPYTPAVANEGAPELPLSFSGDDGSYHRDSRSRLKSSISYSLFPRALQASAPATCFTNPFSPTSPPLTAPPPLSFKCPVASKSSPHLPPPPSLLPSPPMPSCPPPTPPKRKPLPLALNKTTNHQRPFTSHHHKRSGISVDFDAPLSPRSRPPPIPKSATTSPLPSPRGMPPLPPSPPWKPAPISKPATTPIARLPFLDRPLPPLPPAPLANPAPEPVSFFDESDDEDDGAASPGLAARLRGKLHAHRRTASEGKRGVRGAEVAAAQLQRARRGTEGEVVVPERKNVLARMLRMSRI